MLRKAVDDLLTNVAVTEGDDFLNGDHESILYRHVFHAVVVLQEALMMDYL
jgi:hypothetical protein